MSDVSPDLIVDAVTGFHRSAALKAGVDLGVFAAIAHGAATADEIAIRAQAAPRAAQPMRLSRGHGSVGEGARPIRAHEGKPRPSTQPRRPIWCGHRLPRCPGIDFAVHGRSRRLRAQRWLAGIIDRLGGQPDLGDLRRAMTGFVAATADGVAAIASEWDASPRRVLDIAAGHGLFGIAVAKAVPQAEIVAVDWDNVLSVARRNAEAAGVAKRYQTRAGSAFEVDWGTGYDLVLLPNFLHHFDTHTNIGLLRKARENLGPGGRVIAIEFVPAPDRERTAISSPFQLHDAGDHARWRRLHRGRGPRRWPATPVSPRSAPPPAQPSNACRVSPLTLREACWR